jgi:hypothetical protein
MSLILTKVCMFVVIRGHLITIISDFLSPITPAYWENNFMRWEVQQYQEFYFLEHNVSNSVYIQPTFRRNMSPPFSIETSVDLQRNTRRYIPKDKTLRNYRCETLEYYIESSSLTRTCVLSSQGVLGQHLRIQWSRILRGVSVVRTARKPKIAYSQNYT